MDVYTLRRGVSVCVLYLVMQPSLMVSVCLPPAVNIKVLLHARIIRWASPHLAELYFLLLHSSFFLSFISIILCASCIYVYISIHSQLLLHPSRLLLNAWLHSL